MRSIRLFAFLWLFVAVFVSAQAQTWMTTGGNPARNGISPLHGPENVNQPAWTINNALPTGFGNAIFTNHDRFVTSRAVFSPTYRVSVECRKIEDGSLLWKKEAIGEQKFYVVGMTDDAVYVHDYNTDSFYSLNPTDGSIKWVCPQKSKTFGGAHGILFTCNGDPVLNGPGLWQKSLMRVDKNTGEVVWFNDNIVSISPAPDFCVFNEKLYKWVGAIGMPTRLAAIDLNTGATLYYSEVIGGEAVQEIPLTAGPDGTIYGQRDGGALWAFTDDGNSLQVKWFYEPEFGGMGVYGNIGFGVDGSVLFPDGKVIKRLDPQTGTLLSVSPEISAEPMYGTYILTDPDGWVYVCNSEPANGKYYALSPDLSQVFWTLSVPYNYYAGPQLGKEGIMVTAGAGTTLKAFKTQKTYAAVPWFTADKFQIYEGESVVFTDYSSFSPTLWEWEFEGGIPPTASGPGPQLVQYNSPGLYKVKLTAANQYGSRTVTRDCMVEVLPFTGQREKERPGHFIVGPNPSRGNLRIEHKAGLTEKVEIRINDMLGQTVAKVQTTLPASLDLRPTVRPGLYLLVIQKGEETFSQKVLIVPENAR